MFYLFILYKTITLFNDVQQTHLHNLSNIYKLKNIRDELQTLGGYNMTHM